MIYYVSEKQREEFNSLSVKDSLKLLNELTIINLGYLTIGDSETIISYQFGNSSFQIVIDNTTIDIVKYKPLFEEKIIMGWNLKPVAKDLFSKGIVPKKFYDGYLGEHLLNLGNDGTFTFKAAVKKYLDYDLAVSLSYSMTNDKIISLADNVKYMEDVILRQREEIKNKDLTDAITVENNFLMPLAYMEFCGVNVDLQTYKSKLLENNKRVSDIISSINKLLLTECTDSEFRKKYVIDSVQGSLFEKVDNEPGVNIDWKNYNEVKRIFETYKLNKNKKLIDLYDELRSKIYTPKINDPKVYFNFEQLGSVTTRISSNLLSNLPKDLRECFICDKGNKWIAIDYVSQESRILAYLCKDRAMLEEEDMHTKVAQLLYNYMSKDEIKSNPELRNIGKKIEFAINYGGDKNTLVNILGVSNATAERIYNEYMFLFQGVKKYQDKRRREWWDKGYIELCPISRHKVFIKDYIRLKDTENQMKMPNFWISYRNMKKMNPKNELVEMVHEFYKTKSKHDRESINYPIQGTASIYLRLSMAFFYNYLKRNDLLFKVKICATLHDEICVEAPEDIAEEIANVLQTFMIQAGKNLDVKVSRNNDGTLPNKWI